MFHITPVVTSIMIVTIVIFLYTWYKRSDLFDKYLFYPFRIAKKGTWYEFITHGFLHGSMAHLAFNMLTLLFFGFTLEYTIGPWAFLILYFICMIVASFPDYLKYKNNHDYRSVGASGAISGILFSSILFYPEKELMMLFLPIPIPAPIFGLLYLAYSWYADKKGQDNVGHSAHLWGAVCGLVLTILIWPDALQGFINWIAFKLS